MTFREKIERERPNKINNSCNGGVVACPRTYGYPYDVEKVVAELEELSLSYELNCHKMIRENKCHESEDCGICAFKQAIEIVRNGGKE